MYVSAKIKLTTLLRLLENTQKFGTLSHYTYEYGQKDMRELVAAWILKLQSTIDSGRNNYNMTVNNPITNRVQHLDEFMPLANEMYYWVRNK